MTIKETARVLGRFARASRKWMAAGMPVRSPERIAELYQVCNACDKYITTKTGQGRCSLCGCKVNLHGKMNKLLWATESCPLDPPKWTADIDVPERTEEMATDVQQPAPPKTRQQRRQERLAAKLERIRRREARTKRIAERKKREAELPPLFQLPPNDDPLEVTDRDGRPTNHCLRNLWAPAAGFLVCGGPSLKSLDLSPLKERGIASLGVNNVAGMAPVRAFICGDPPEKFHHGIFTDPALVKFGPIRRLGQRVRAKKPDGTFGYTALRVKDCPNVFGFRRDSHWEPEAFFTRDAATWGRGKGQAKEQNTSHILFSFFLGLRMMHYLGCQRVYLLGVDFSMDAERGYAFPQGRTEGAIRGNNNSYRIAVELSLELKPIFDRVGFEVYNCYRQSRLSAFPFVPYEEALEDCRGLTPKEPYDLSQWYEKDNDPNGQSGDSRGES